MITINVSKTIIRSYNIYLGSWEVGTFLAMLLIRSVVRSRQTVALI